MKKIQVLAKKNCRNNCRASRLDNGSCRNMWPNHVLDLSARRYRRAGVLSRRRTAMIWSCVRFELVVVAGPYKQGRS